MAKKNLLSYITLILVWIIACDLYAALHYLEMLSRSVSVQDGANLFFSTIGWTTLLALIPATIHQLVDLFLNRTLSRKRSFLFFILIHVLAFTLPFVIIMVVLFSLGPSIIGVGTKAAALSQQLLFRGLHITIFSVTLFKAITLYRQLSHTPGKTNMFGIVRGRYVKPKEEKRICMFLDLVGTRKLVEKLGETSYTSLIQELFSEIGFYAEKYNAEIYQYMGDGVILMWNYKEGLRKILFYHFFNSFSQRLTELNPFFESRYGIQPRFKAGINCGTVIVAQVGSFNRQIAYYGEMIETTARLESACTGCDQNLLFTQPIAEVLQKSAITVTEQSVLPIGGQALPIKVYSL